jgi:PAS domain S-box-containing protein
METGRLFEQSLIFNKLIIESMSDGVICIDNNFICTYINSSALKMLGYTHEDCIGNNLHDLIHNKELYPGGECPACQTLVNKEGRNLEKVFWRSDGGPIWVRYTSNPIVYDLEFIGFVILFSDISDQKKGEGDSYNSNKKLSGEACLSKDVAEETSNHIALIESYNELENIFNQSMDIICVFDGEGRFRKISNACEKILGYKIEELMGRSFFDFIYDEDLDQTKKVAADIMNGAEVTNFENRYIAKNGCLVPIIWSARWDKKENLMFCVARDATEKKIAEKKLIQSEAFLEEAQRLAKMGSWNFDLKTDTVTWSKELYNIFGGDANPTVKTHRSFVNLIDEQDKQLVKLTSKHAQKTGEPFNIQYRIITPNGETRVIEEFGYGEKDTDGKVIRLFGTAQDITARKKTEEKIREIGWIQSHLVRAPVARIIGLVLLIKGKLIDENEMENVLDYLLLSTTELDGIIKDISNKTISND